MEDRVFFFKQRADIYAGALRNLPARLFGEGEKKTAARENDEGRGGMLK